MAPNNLLCLILICRIERLWRDVRIKVIQFYMDLFKFERTGMRIDNEWHIFTLQYMFMTRIPEDLNLFKNIRNNHALSTEQNKTPLQLMILRRDDTAPDECIDVDEYGVDEFDDDASSRSVLSFSSSSSCTVMCLLALVTILDVDKGGSLASDLELDGLLLRDVVILEVVFCTVGGIRLGKEDDVCVSTIVGAVAENCEDAEYDSG